MLISACNLFHHNDLEVTVSESEERYQFTAYFDESKTGKVQAYINDAVSPAGVFNSRDHKLNTIATLDDKTTFHINASPGKLTITLNKKENTQAAYHRIKKIGEGVQLILVQAN